MEPRSLVRSVTEVRIVEAAAQLFARHGFKAATTREIAHLAGLNEVTIFRYFLHKPALFWAAVESRLSSVKLGRALQMDLAADREPAIVVPQFISFLLESLEQRPDLCRLLQVAVFELPGVDRVIREHLGPIFDAISDYFQRCTERGAIHPMPASLPTLGILGTVIAHSKLSPLIPITWPQAESIKQRADALTELWLRALSTSVPARTLSLIAQPASGSGDGVSAQSMRAGDLSKDASASVLKRAGQI